MIWKKINFQGWITSIYREIIYTIIGIVVIVPILLGIKEQVQISPSVRAAYETVESLDSTDVIIISIDCREKAANQFQRFLKNIFSGISGI